MKYKKYSKYKDSGVEWIGEVPEGWEVKKLKYSVDLYSKKSNGNANERPYVGLEHIESQTGRLIPDFPITFEGDSKEFDSGDVLFGKLRPYLAKAILADFAGTCSGELLVLRGNDIKPDLLHHLVLSDGFIQLVNSATYGVKMPRAEWSMIGNIFIPIPKEKEQNEIYDFLQKQTTQFDELIAKSKAQVTLLEEKRQATINQAVTKGLDPSVPMKDSGVEWIGEIPEHWEVIGLTKCCDIISGTGFPVQYQGNINYEFPFYKVNDTNLLNNRVYMNDCNNTIKKEDINILKAKIAPKNSIVFPKIGAALLKNKRRILTKPSIFDNNMMALVPKRHNEKFLYYFLLVVDFAMITNPGPVPSLGDSNIRLVKAPLPPILEEDKIADFLDKQTTQFDELIAKSKAQVTLLEEKRQALITATVTGKIDVRK
jgi:type I restriction enzyme S subunit